MPTALIKHKQGCNAKPDTEDGVDKEQIYGRTTIVEDMHTRKNTMAEEVIAGGPGSGFIALSGGYDTLEEIMEMVAW
jgi:predicted Rossmann-fold nucleotide-binding protein